MAACRSSCHAQSGNPHNKLSTADHARHVSCNKKYVELETRASHGGWKFAYILANWKHLARNCASSSSLVKPRLIFLVLISIRLHIAMLTVAHPACNTIRAEIPSDTISMKSSSSKMMWLALLFQAFKFNWSKARTNSWALCSLGLEKLKDSLKI